MGTNIVMSKSNPTTSERIVALEVKVDAYHDEVRGHTSNKLLHLGTLFGASGPVLLGIFKLLGWI